MSRFFDPSLSALEPYVPGEQPKDMKYIKLNTNESPFPPSPAVEAAVAAETGKLNLYCDPECTELRAAAAELYGTAPENLIAVNGSDEILYFAFMAFGAPDRPFAFPDISYGFYSVFAAVNHIPAHIIPLRDDFTISADDYCGLNENIVIANPNAPTGILLPVCDIERIVRSNPDNVVIIDEAYIDFGGESCVPLTKKYDNLLVTQTFSKSRSLAGARLGFGIGCEGLIRDLNTIRYSFNPYNVNRMTQAAGVAACRSDSYYRENALVIEHNREYTTDALISLGFEVLPSRANFIFARSEAISGNELYLKLKSRGILVRWFSGERIRDFVRITIGTKQDMDQLLNNISIILKEGDHT